MPTNEIPFTIYQCHFFATAIFSSFSEIFPSTYKYIISGLKGSPHARWGKEKIAVHELRNTRMVPYSKLKEKRLQIGLSTYLAFKL